MALKGKTILAFIGIVAIAAIAIEIFTIYWVVVGITLIFLFTGSMFFFAYLDTETPSIPKQKRWPAVSVIIPCYNSESTIKRCIESAIAMKYHSKVEIIVINDASTDSSLEIMKKIPGIKIIGKKKNEGKAAGINSALKVANGELVCCIDSDTYPASDALEKAVPFFTDETVGAVTCLILANEPKSFFEHIQNLEYLLGFGFYQTMLSQLDAAMITPGPMCVYSKKALLDVGGYDEKNITEDMEIALRLQKHSYKIKASPYAKVYTVVPNTFRQWVRQRLRWYRGKIYNTVKYREMLFNSKNGFLGNFSLPFTFMLEMGAVFILFLVAVILAQSFLFVAEVILSAASINYSMPIYFPPLIIHSSAIFFFTTTLSTFGLALAVSFDLAKEKFRLKDIPAVIFIILFYGIMVALMWLMSLFKEINRSDYAW